MINRKHFFLACFTFLFLSTIDVNAQKTNQFDVHKKRTGVWKKYYKNKKIRYVGQFKNGKEIGTFRFYDKTSSSFPIAIKEFYTNSDSVNVSYFFLNGKLKTKGMFLERNRIGKWTYFFENGKVLSEESYKDGLLSGPLKIFYKNGKLTEDANYQKGLLHGVSKKYSEAGVLIEKITYINGKEDGEASYYELKGNLKERGSYKNGKRIGKWEFYLNGEALSEEEQKKLKRHQRKDN